MGTPLKQIKNLLSPARSVRSPNIIRNFGDVPLLKSENQLAVPVCYTTPTKSFPSLKTNTELGSSRIQAYLNPEKTAKHREILIVNTPNRQTILKYGITQNSNWNVLGRGSFGTVVQGTYKGESVAAKIIKNKEATREKNALKLRHANVIRTISVLQDETKNYSIVLMECLKGWVQLKNLLESKDFNLDFVNIAIQISKGLSYCHENGIMHLDIKPANILVNENKFCKICDFGNSMKSSESRSHYEHKGTVIYTAPEILMGKPPTIKSDIYSLGLIFWQLRHQENPFCNYMNSQVLIYKVIKFNIRPSTKEDFQDEYANLYCRCWEKEPENRPNINAVLYKLCQM